MLLRPSYSTASGTLLGEVFLCHQLQVWETSRTVNLSEAAECTLS
jgi:hypothetical protein